MSNSPNSPSNMTGHCGSCAFWESEYQHANGSAHCRRSAPIATKDSKVAQAVALLLWWYIQEHADEKTANEQLDAFGLHTEAEQTDDDAFWPYTMPYDWCGQWGERPMSDLVQAAG